VWKLTRKLCIHDQYFPTIAAVITVVETQFEKWANGNVTHLGALFHLSISHLFMSPYIEGKVPADQAEGYKKWLLGIAGKVANAATEGGFLGFGGDGRAGNCSSSSEDARRSKA
jgi:hypothetical protein